MSDDLNDENAMPNPNLKNIIHSTLLPIKTVGVQG